MNRPELIEIDENAVFADNVLENLRLDKIFPLSVLKYLKYGCCREEVKERRSFFRALENPVFNDALNTLLEDMMRFEKTKELFRNSASETRKLYLKVRLADIYVKIITDTVRMKGFCRKTDRYAEFFSENYPNEVIEKMESDLCRIKEILKSVSEFCVSFRSKAMLSKKYQPQIYFENLKKCGDAMGLEPPVRRSFLSDFDGTLSDSFTALFRTEVSEVITLLASFGKLTDTDFSSDISAACFYLQIKEFTGKVKVAGLPVCFPSFSADKTIHFESLYDITMFNRIGKDIVPSDAHFDASAPFYFIIGANGGGKTTFLRAVGVNILLTMTGCPVFADSASVFPLSKIYLHFPKDERFENSGRYDEEVRRANEMLENADDRTLLLFNETFSGTDEKKGSEMTVWAAKETVKKGAFGLFVTHFLSVETSGFPLMQCEVINTQNEKNKRTFRIVRTENKAHSFALDILRKYRLDRTSLIERRKKGNDQYT